MRFRQQRLAVVLCVAVFAMFAAPARSAEKSRQVLWAEQMLKQRQAVMHDRQTLPQQSTWQLSQALPAASFNDAPGPEKRVDLAAKGPDGKPLWRAMPGLGDGEPHSLASGDRTATYLYRTIECPQPMKTKLALGSDDGAEVWLNGRRIHSNNVPRVLASGQDSVPLELKQGMNTLLVKIYNISGGCGFYYSLGGSAAGSDRRLGEAFPSEMDAFRRHFPGHAAWFSSDASTQLEQKAIASALKRLKNPQPQKAQFDALVQRQAPASDPAWLALFAESAGRLEALRTAPKEIARVDFQALRRSISALQQAYPDRYRAGRDYLSRIDALEKQAADVEQSLRKGDDQAAAAYLSAYRQLQFNALVRDNPAVDFDRILLVRREAGRLGLPQNWQANTSIDPRMDNEIDELNIKDPASALKRIYKPAENWFVGDLNLHFDGSRLLFSSIGANRRWQVFEMKTDGSGVTQVTPGDAPDIDNFNGIYLPDGRIIFDSNASFLGVPCVGGSDYVANLHLLSADRKSVRRLCFEQDNDWYPTLLPDGRVMYLRWEYTDSAHYFSRLLMAMNPDGTGQIEYYGSNSYWPNGIFYAKALPGDASRFVGVVSGHHGVARMGELVLFNTARGRQENSGAIQRIPGYGKPVVDLIKDTLVDSSWPKFLHPVPLSDTFFLVSCKPSPDANWGIYLVDIYDNMVLIREESGQALLEPVPLRRTPVPPSIPDRTRPGVKTATVSIQDIYTGRGLPGVPRGTVKSLRLYQYEYAYRNMGGHYCVGIEGPWDVHSIIGTVPVYPDGSALFTIPANTPVSVQPLDAEGKALQLKRSWLVGMPGEYVSCNGCHDMQNSAAVLKRTEASTRPPATPKPWYGPTRGFDFLREVQPVLDKYCIGCHDGTQKTPNLANTNTVHTTMGGSFPQSYIALHPYVRRNGPEGDYHTLTPLEFYADTSDLVQMLQKNHYNVKLDAEAWDRLITWIDLNVPAHGTWREIGRIPSNFQQRRREMNKSWSGLDEDIESILNPYKRTEKFIQPEPMAPKPAPVSVPGWPFSAEKAGQMQAALGQAQMTLDLGKGNTIRLVRIPAGEFEMGDRDGYPDEYPTAKVRIDKPYWMAVTEVSLQQYQQFDPAHENGYYDMHYKDQVRPGYLMDHPNLPVIRVSCREAQAFCQWLSQKTGRKVSLPTEAQWEWACRAGTATPLSYGDLNSDFSTFANLGDRELKKLAVQGVDPQPIANPDRFWDFVPKDDRFDDGTVHLAEVGHYQANAWGLKDMHGNVAEWTRSTYRPYPYNPALEDSGAPGVKKVVRGGSWYDRPKHARSGFRQVYRDWEKVYNVGIRIIIEE